MDKLNANQQLLLATALVDNHLAAAEADLLRQIFSKQGLSNHDIAEALQSRPPALASLVSQMPGGQAREDVMRDVLRMCFSDGILEYEEFDLIERLAGQLGLNEETLERIRNEVSGE